MTAKRLRLRLRTLPEYLAVTTAAFKISETANMMVSRLLSMSPVHAPPKYMKTSSRGSIVAQGGWKHQLWACVRKCYEINSLGRMSRGPIYA